MKYMGSKERIADEIVPIITANRKPRQVFIDLFCGGLSISQRVDGPVIANDIQKYLIAMWESLQNGWTPPMRIEREFYADVRNSYNKRDGRYADDIIGWVGFMASYNGRFFDGGYSGHHVEIKNGKFRDYITENINNTLSQRAHIGHISLMSKDYRDVPLPSTCPAIIYADPPYRGTKQYSTSKDFDHEAFYDYLRQKAAEGHQIFVSEYAMPDDFRCVWSKALSTTINQTITKKPVEKLFTI